MEQEVVFRGMLLGSNTFVFGNLITYFDSKSEKTRAFIANGEVKDNELSLRQYEVRPETVGMGQRASNFIQHYTGDIVTIISPFHPNFKGTVTFSEGSFWVDSGTNALPLWDENYHWLNNGNIFTETKEPTAEELIEKHKIKVVSYTKAFNIVDKPMEAESGLYLLENQNCSWVAIDNKTNEAWTEEFPTQIEAINWLIGNVSEYTETETNCKGCFGPCGRCEEKEVE